MSSRLEEIGRRKQALIERAARQRSELTAIVGRIRSPLDISQTIIGLGRALKTHPLIAAAASSFIVSGYASRLVRTTAELLKLWRLILPVWAWFRSRKKSA